MIIDCISDLHGYYPELEGGDLLIVAGDLTARDDENEHEIEFAQWFLTQRYKYKIFIAGNHDNHLQNHYIPMNQSLISYLCDSGTKFEGLKIWGSPWSCTFPGINPHCTAFTGTEDILANKFALIPEDTDILITHTPPHGILDESFYKQRCGSIELRNIVLSKERMPKLKLHVFGHIHENGGKEFKMYPSGLHFVNASIVNLQYQHVNKPVRIVL